MDEFVDETPSKPRKPEKWVTPFPLSSPTSIAIILIVVWCIITVIIFTAAIIPDTNKIPR